MKRKTEQDMVGCITLLRKGLFSTIVMASLLIFLGNTAFAMGMDWGDGGDDSEIPDTTDKVMATCVSLPSTQYPISSPTAVAVDRDGRQYVADPLMNRVVVLSQSGEYLASLIELAKPISVAVDSIGRVYVGNAGKGNVEVYDSDFTLLYKLGFADNEFGQPNSIAVDSAGYAYVADKKKNVVRMYDSQGNYAGLLGEPGQGDGEFHHPLSITIDEVAEEIIVLDQASRARVQFFDMGGTFIRSFERYGDNIGDMARPQQVAVDKESRLYVSDSLQNVVLVYDSFGYYLGVINDLNHPMRTPVGIAISESNRMYVASRLTPSVDIYGIDDYTSMAIDPIRLTFEAKDSGENPAAQTITVFNNGLATFAWNAVANDSWFSLSDVTGVLDKSQAGSFDVSVDITGLAPGEYEGSITVATGQGATEVVDIDLTVVPAARLVAEPGILSFTSDVGTTPGPEAFTIANTGSAPLNWSISTDQDWISVSHSYGTLAQQGAQDVTVLADISSLAAGIYIGTITVFGNGAIDSPETIAVTLTLSEPIIPPGVGGPTPDKRVLEEMVWTVGDNLPLLSLNSVWTGAGSLIFAVGEDGTILHYDGTEWSVMDGGTNADLYSVWGSIDTDCDVIDVYAVGESGMVLHYNGNDWESMVSSTTDKLKGVWGASATNVYSVGEDGTILHYNGTNWSSMNSYTNRDLHGIWGMYDDLDVYHVYAVGDGGTILHYNGSQWVKVKTSAKQNLYGVWGVPGYGVYAVGEDGVILKSHGSKWIKWTTKDVAVAGDLHGIWGESEADIYAVGSGGIILHYDGKIWSTEDSATVRDLHSVHGSRELGMIAVGRDMTVLYYDGAQWQSLMAAGDGLNSVWGRSASDVFTVGQKGLIKHYDGSGWSDMESPTTNTLYSVWGKPETDLYAVGVGGAILKYNGVGWTATQSPVSGTLYGVWGTPQTEMFAVGQGGTFLRSDGNNWYSLKDKIKADLYSLWGRSANDVYVVGQEGVILHYNGKNLSTMTSPTVNDLYSVWGCSETSMFAVGAGGTFLQYSGSGWTSLVSTTTSNLYGVWCSSATDVFIVGQDETFLYYDGESVRTIDFENTGSLHSVWGSMETSNIIAVGSGAIILHGWNE